MLQIELDAAEITALDVVDHRGVDWSRVRRTAYLIHQSLRYEYSEPIRDLRHRLVIVPPSKYGDQDRIMQKVSVSATTAKVKVRDDEFGNVVLDISVARVAREIAFEAWIVLERRVDAGPVALPGELLADPRLLSVSELTRPDDGLGLAASDLGLSGLRGLDLADAICTWVHGYLTYAHGVTAVRTTAAEAFAIRSGVCQDYAHVMLSICRLLGLPARYVSGHRLGEGGTHAWVEVLVPAATGPAAIGVAFDPTHGRRANLGYITVALGRDYLDVAPTSGTFRAGCSGELSSRRRVALTAVDYAAESA